MPSDGSHSLLPIFSGADCGGSDERRPRAAEGDGTAGVPLAEARARPRLHAAPSRGSSALPCSMNASGAHAGLLRRLLRAPSPTLHTAAAEVTTATAVHVEPTESVRRGQRRVHARQSVRNVSLPFSQEADAPPSTTTRSSLR
jgi:hypothetical protein